MPFCMESDTFSIARYCAGDVAGERGGRAADVGGVPRGRSGAWALLCDPDIEWDGTNLPDGELARGHQAVVDHAARWVEMWDDWKIEPERFIDAGGDQVLIVFREVGRSTSGLQMDELHAELYTVRGGKVVYRKGFSDPAEALDAAGLRE
jgi:ketosteroid isomerase-like protein